MHVIVHVIPVKPDTVDAARALFESKVPPLAERFSGRRGARLLATDDDHLVTVGMWVDRAQMEEFLAQPAFEHAMAAFAELFAASPTTFVTREATVVGPAAS